eukprot:TRINITY_DN734_c0_g1_i2.p1 TRINITY_DN734_c0_g1~~TRINITY_DN734_c0_g1_i2.p1  ORF type:complete len:772 (+),score=148.98 TRINITY_DN734_c0_g1_i2:156-2471(+)
MSPSLCRVLCCLVLLAAVPIISTLKQGDVRGSDDALPSKISSAAQNLINCVVDAPNDGDQCNLHFWVYFNEKDCSRSEEERLERALVKMHPRALFRRLKSSEYHAVATEHLQKRQPELMSFASLMEESNFEVTLPESKADIYRHVLGNHRGPHLPHQHIDDVQRRAMGDNATFDESARFPAVLFRQTFEAAFGVDPLRLLSSHDVEVCGDYASSVRDIIHNAEGDYYVEDGDDDGNGGGHRHHATSRYLNAISVRLDPFVPSSSTPTETSLRNLAVLNAIASLPYVRSIDIVMGNARAKGDAPVEDKHNAHEEAPVDEGRPSERAARAVETGQEELDYGASGTQVRYSKADELHMRGLTGDKVLMMICDSGARLSIPSGLPTGPDQLMGQYDFVNNDASVENGDGDSSSQDNHGTHTFSIIGASAPGEVYGTAYGAQFMIAKTESVPYEYLGEETNFIEALEWGDHEGVEVVSASLGYTQWYSYENFDGKSSVLAMAIEHFVIQGVVIVVSVDNYGQSGIGGPADAFRVISVGAMTSSGNMASYSSRGPTFDGRIKPEVSTMGSGVRYINPTQGTGPAFGYGSGSGTSYACPLVAGIVALVLEEHPNWSAEVVRDALMMSSNHATAPNNDIGWGRVDAVAFCDYDVDESPCPLKCGGENRGQCTTTSNEESIDVHFCECSDGYYGRNCQFDKIPCSEVCSNGGTCVGEKCTCPGGDWRGKQCQTPGCHKFTSCDKCKSHKGVSSSCGWCDALKECIHHSICTDGTTPGTKC